MKLSHQDCSRICRGLSLLLHAGISLSDGIFLLAQEEEKETATLLTELGSAMDNGADLPQALEEQQVFPELIIGMCRIGQESGRLEESLLYLADYYDERIRRNRQIKNALAYPSLILFLMLAVITVLLVKVLPIFAGVYASLGSSLGGAAAALLKAGQIIGSALPLLLLLLVAVCGAGLFFRYNSKFREKVSAFFLTRYGDKGLAKKFNNAQFARALSMGMASGLTLEDSMDLAQKLLSHIPAAAKRCESCRELLDNGEDLAQAMAQTELLPKSQSKLLSLGIRGGSGEQVMENIAARLSEEAEESLEDLVSKVEPAMVLICSALVGLILLAVMLPLMNIMSVIG